MKCATSAREILPPPARRVVRADPVAPGPRRVHQPGGPDQGPVQVAGPDRRPPSARTSANWLGEDPRQDRLRSAPRVRVALDEGARPPTRRSAAGRRPCPSPAVMFRAARREQAPATSRRAGRARTARRRPAIDRGLTAAGVGRARRVTTVAARPGQPRRPPVRGQRPAGRGPGPSPRGRTASAQLSRWPPIRPLPPSSASRMICSSSVCRTAAGPAAGPLPGPLPGLAGDQLGPAPRTPARAPPRAARQREHQQEARPNTADLEPQRPLQRGGEVVPHRGAAGAGQHPGRRPAARPGRRRPAPVELAGRRRHGRVRRRPAGRAGRRRTGPRSGPPPAPARAPRPARPAAAARPRARPRADWVPSSPKKITPMTAMPIELPSCRPVLNTPDAEPACCAGTRSSTMSASGAITAPRPRPAATRPGTRSQVRHGRAVVVHDADQRRPCPRR